MVSSSLNITKVDKLKRPQVFVQSKRRVKEVTARDDSLFIAFIDEPNKSNENHLQRISSNTKAKCTIIFCLGDAALAKKSNVVDGDGSAHKLRIQSKKIFNMSSTQSVTNLQIKIKYLSFREGDNWDEHVSFFLYTLDELVAQDQLLFDADKEKEMLRTLPQLFNAMEMTSDLNNTTFDQIVNAIQRNIERKKCLGTREKNNAIFPQVGTSSRLASDSSSFFLFYRRSFKIRRRGRG